MTDPAFHDPETSLPAASASATGEGTVQHLSFNTMPVEAMSRHLSRQFITGERTMLARVLLKKGCIVPEHQHENEQLAYILEGALRFTIAGRERIVRAGEVLVIPSNIPHSAEALEDTIDLDIFTPPRADWIAGDDAYLRGK